MNIKTGSEPRPKPSQAMAWIPIATNSTTRAPRSLPQAARPLQPGQGDVPARVVSVRSRHAGAPPADGSARQALPHLCSGGAPQPAHWHPTDPHSGRNHHREAYPSRGGQAESPWKSFAVRPAKQAGAGQSRQSAAGPGCAWMPGATRDAPARPPAAGRCRPARRLQGQDCPPAMARPCAGAWP